jgi:hypothetical protein
MSGEASSAIVRFDADFKKVQGTLSVTASHIAWVPKVRDAMDRQNQLLSRVTSECAIVLWNGIGVGRGRRGLLGAALVDFGAPGSIFGTTMDGGWPSRVGDLPSTMAFISISIYHASSQ